jgi:hypothetical protein
VILAACGVYANPFLVKDVDDVAEAKKFVKHAVTEVDKQ